MVFVNYRRNAALPQTIVMLKVFSLGLLKSSLRFLTSFSNHYFLSRFLQVLSVCVLYTQLHSIQSLLHDLFDPFSISVSHYCHPVRNPWRCQMIKRPPPDEVETPIWGLFAGLPHRMLTALGLLNIFTSSRCAATALLNRLAASLILIYRFELYTKGRFLSWFQNLEP